METNKPTFHDFLVAVTFDGIAHFISEITDKKPEDTLENFLDGSYLSDNLSNNENIPTKPGIYKCNFRFRSYKVNIPIDPDEWDYDFTIEKCEVINLNNLIKNEN